jgi:sulfur-oxidizing protein SoxZ
MLARIQLPKSATRGEVISVRIAIQHPMETGFRFDVNGRAVPKNVINTLTVRYNNAEVFRAEMGTGVAANPLLQFYTVAEASGEFVFDWVDDSGQRGTERATLVVQPG